MANLYGVANPLPKPQVYTGSGDVVCAAGATTVVQTTGPIVAISNGYFYPMLWPTIILLIGATGPTLLYIGFNINGGSFVDFIQVDGNFTPASATVNVTACLVGVASQAAWQGVGSTINIAVNPTGQSVTYRNYESRSVVGLFRAPDQ